MSSLFDVLNTVNVALQDDEGFDFHELDRAVAELHLKLTEPKWAIEDEVLRDECQKLVVQWATQRYLDTKQYSDSSGDDPWPDTSPNAKESNEIMKKLIEDCDDHNYVYLKTTSETLLEPTYRVINKEIYACADCGVGLDVYELEEGN